MMENSAAHLTRRKPKKPKKKWKKPLIITLSVLLVLGGLGFIYQKQLVVFAFNMFASATVKDALDDSFKPAGDKDAPVVEHTDPFSLLLLGIDQRDNEPSRSDTIIYSVVRPEDNKVLLLSIPRDSYTEIVGRDVKSKINSAYAHGEAKMAMDTVENLLGNKVDFYAAINFNGLKDIVDAVGGVELPIKKNIENKLKIHEKLFVEANKPIYSGEEALGYVRYREDSDFNRTMRHRIFLSAFMNRALEVKNLTKIPDVIQIAGSNFTTNMTSDFIVKFAESLYMKDSIPTISNYMLKGEGATRSGTWYYDLSEDDLQYVRGMIASWLDPDATEIIEPESADQSETSDAA
ncbi:LCP family protein [Paenibacillus sp. W2I17]|uniref:LCP family protein n=1 Tax=Paenibacillus sp. W2I17 TaxID=3042311 RepID=UPI00277E035F|nr:LCP family protein [Paenibacillus sp. W2I17]MDQ0659606.1 LCP family protein required for cell wall assembly [Paenibacillus sp. W2I17]